MTTVSFIGSGNIGGALARLAVAAGYDVVLSNSREPWDRARRQLPRPRPGQRATWSCERPVDADPLGPGGRRFQFGTGAFVTPYGGLSDERGAPAGVATIRAVLGL